MQYLYYFSNASLTLRLVNYLINNPDFFRSTVTVISQIDGWIVRVKTKPPLPPQQDGNFKAFLNELGVLYSPSKHIILALMNLDAGCSAIDVMRRFNIIIVSHGLPQCEGIEAFREDFINGLGYCPQNLA